MCSMDFDPWSVQTKDYNIGISFLATKHAASRSKNKDWLAQSQNVPKKSGMSTCGLLLQWASTLKIYLSVLT